MQENEPAPRPRLLQRPTTRRALLAGAATAAAGGTAAAVIGLAANANGGGGDSRSNSQAESPTPDEAKLATERLKQPISDPKHRAAHLLRRAGWGGTPAQIEEFAALSREEAASRLIDYDTVDNSALNARVERAAFNLTTPGRGLEGGSVGELPLREEGAHQRGERSAGSIGSESSRAMARQREAGSGPAASM